MNADESDALTELAHSMMCRARDKGADVAEVSARSGWELSARVRLGKPELVEEAGHKSLALRIIKNQRVALTATSDLSDAGLQRCLDDAFMLAELSEPDAFAGPADPKQLAKPPFFDLDLYDASVAEIDTDEALDLARRAERAALDYDKRLTLSEGASFARTESSSVMVLSSGFVGSLRGSYASLAVSPVAEDTDGKKRRGQYWTAARHRQGLEDAEGVGEEAARRTLAKLGAKKVKTTEAAIVFDAEVARSVIGTFAGCILGGSLWRKSSYLLGRKGTAVASPLVTLIDDPLIPRAPGSRPFDGEGLATRKNVVVDGGGLQTYLLDTYGAKKLGLESTHSAARSGGKIAATTSNFLMSPGSISRDELIARTPRGLYVTEMMGFGFNAITGDFSRGAAGFWIEDGRFLHPVSEVTISGNLDTMLKNIDLVAEDLILKTSTAAPTFRVSSMTISGV